MIEYKIRQKSTGLYYTGGRWGYWTKRGRFYSSKNLALSIAQAATPCKDGHYEIVAFKVEEIIE